MAAGDLDLAMAALLGGHPVAWFGTLRELVEFAETAGMAADELHVHGTIVPVAPEPEQGGSV